MAVYTIRDKKDWKCATQMCRWLEQYQAENGCGEKQREYLEQLKRDIRKYTHKKPNEYDNGYFKFEARHVRSYDFYGDGYVELISFPNDCGCESIEDAKEFFDEWFYIEPYYTYYDCTGKPFTSWYHVFKRNGRYYAYHSVSYDV